jgi:calpain
MGSHDELLKECFWPYKTNSTDLKPDAFKDSGLFVCRFFKDCSVIYVIIDDRIPVMRKGQRLAFSMCKDPNELWVPIIEKAYAKIHGNYKSLIGGFTHIGLSDLTGFCPRLIVTKQGITGYCQPYTNEDIWTTLLQYKEWESLMGCSIQNSSKEKATELSAGEGLMYGHAYSLLDLQVVKVGNKDVRLIKCRNPWGRGEWTGAYSDGSVEKIAAKEAISDKFKVDVEDSDDGIFFITLEDWMKKFTNLFIAIKFPSDWNGVRCMGTWNGNSGGSRLQPNWICNPKIKIKFKENKEEKCDVFVGLYIRDTRMTLGGEYYTVRIFFYYSSIQ